jgi:CIC family chloride channel protein
LDHDRPQYVPTHPLRWIPEFLDLSQRRFRAQGRLLGASILVGIVAGLAAILFAVATQVVVHFTLDRVVGYQPPGPSGEASVGWLHETATPLRPWLLLVVPAVGGVVSGLIVFKLAPEAEGHGTDSAIEAYHFKEGQIRGRVPLVKLIASAITLGTGGSGGREGPIAQIGAGCGSVLGKLLRMRPADRRVLLAAGIGAGVAAIFRAPLAGALFAAEVLYRSPEFEAEVILPAGLASVISYCTFGSVFGWQPLFTTPTVRFTDPLQLGPYLLLALLMAALAMVYTRTFYGMTHLFRRWPAPPWLKPMAGALATGGVGIVLYYAFGEEAHALSVLSFGYGILQQGLTDPAPLGAALLLAVAFGKILTTSLTIGSGGSGGGFGPSMVIGGCAGEALGLVLHEYWPWLVPHPETFLILGMAGFFAAAAKTPFSTLIIVSELTGDYQLLLPAIWVCSIAYLFSDEQSLYSWQVATRSRSPAHQGGYVREVLAGMMVRQFLRDGADGPVLHPQDDLARVMAAFDETPVTVLPVVDGDRKFLGIVNLEEVHLAAQSPHLRPWLVAADLARANVTPLSPDQSLDKALELFVENDLLALPVVAEDTGQLLGMVRRSELSQTYLRHVHGPAVRRRRTLTARRRRNPIPPRPAADYNRWLNPRKPPG